jgi:FemAB-related protein (PEP-CTERM system-associated)
MQIIRCDESHAEAWDRFVSQQPTGSFYHRFGWKAVNERSFGHKSLYLAAVSDHEIRGVFPLVAFKGGIFGKLACSMPFVNYGGICTADAEAERLLLQEARSLVKQLGYDYLEIRSTRKLGEDLLTSEHKVSMTIALDKDPDTLWNALKTKHRTAIRHAYKNDLTVSRGGSDLLDVFYDILSRSWRSLGTPVYRKSYFENILRAFPRETAIFVVRHKEIPIATAFNGHSHGTVEGMWAGVLPEHRRLDPNYALYWEMIKDACERGFQTYHLGRSSVDSGAEAFKKKWNAYPTQLYWQYMVRDGRPMPSLNVTNPKFHLAIQVWKRLPLRVTQLLGPLVAKGIP